MLGVPLLFKGYNMKLGPSQKTYQISKINQSISNLEYLRKELKAGHKAGADFRDGLFLEIDQIKEHTIKLVAKIYKGK